MKKLAETFAALEGEIIRLHEFIEEYSKLSDFDKRAIEKVVDAVSARSDMLCGHLLFAQNPMQAAALSAAMEPDIKQIEQIIRGGVAKAHRWQMTREGLGILEIDDETIN